MGATCRRSLYHYFASRDELLTELLIDAYDDLADALRHAVGATRDRRARKRFEALARAFRAWAIAQPDRYRLLYGPPLPGYDAHADRLIAAGQKSMNLLVDILQDADWDELHLARSLRSQLSKWARGRRIDVDDIDAPTALRAVLIWSRLHGFVSLEIGGNFAGMGIDAEALFEIEVASMAPQRMNGRRLARPEVGEAARSTRCSRLEAAAHELSPTNA